MLTGRLILESLQVGKDIEVPGLRVVRVGRHDVTDSTTPSGDRTGSDTPGAVGDQPRVWTFLDFEAPDELAEELAAAIAEALSPEFGWWADFRDSQDHFHLFANKVFRYRLGDEAGRAESVAYGRAHGTPEHQLDWGP